MTPPVIIYPSKTQAYSTYVTSLQYSPSMLRFSIIFNKPEILVGIWQAMVTTHIWS